MSELPIQREGNGASLRFLSDFGGMTASVVELPAGTELGPLFEGLPGDACTSPHWGYQLKGRCIVSYSGGAHEVVEAGQIFFLPAGHTAKTIEDSICIAFSPDEEYQAVLEHMSRRRGCGGGS